MTTPLHADDAENLALAGTRFADATVEERYLDWAFARLHPTMVQFTRVTIVVLAAVALALALLADGALGTIYATLALLFVVTLAIDRALARRERGAAMRWAALSNLISVVLAVLLGERLSGLDGGGLAVAVGVFTCQFVTGTARERPIIAITSGVLTVGLVASLRVEAWRAGTLGARGVLVECVLLSVSCLVALSMAKRSDADARTEYAQSRIIAAQHATIVRQQAALERELAHQVAERSRELGAVLAKSDVTLDVRALKPGERFADRYDVTRALGAGGMGAVYEVTRVTDGAQLALKAVVGEVSSSAAARFAREAEIGARIRHPNLVAIVDVGVSVGVPYLVMELVRGGSLDSQRAHFGEPAWALPILKQIALGLAALHDAGVVHRDLKPANVLFDGTVAKISDFGISRFGALDESGRIDAQAATQAMTPKRVSPLTGTGVVMGTPLYMAPEAAKSARQLDASADVFAFGIMAYEMLTGRSPFSVPALVLAMADQPITPPPPIDDARVNEALRALVMDCLHREPSRRPRARALVSSIGLDAA